MHRRRKKRKKSYEDKIKGAILEHKTFSLHIDNTMEFKLVSEMVTDYLLRDYPERERLLMFAEELPKVKHALHAAIKKLEKEGHCVLRGPRDGRLQWITLTPNYRKAKEQDSERSLKQASNKVNLTIEHLNLSDPDKLPEFRKSIIATVSSQKKTQQKLLVGTAKKES
jgi:DNA-binding MarR family transcriptional regulator